MKPLRLIDGLDKRTRQQWEALAQAYVRGGEAPIINNYCSQRAAAHVRSADQWQGWTRLIEDGSFNYDGTEKTLDFHGVTEGEKRDGSRVRVEGIDVENLKVNPVFVGFHQYGEPNIGRIVATRLGETRTGKRSFIISVARLATPEVRENGSVNRYVQKGNELMDMAEGGDMRAVSFGWRGLEFEPILSSDDKVKGWDFIRSEALEFSLVTVPADADATAVRALQRRVTEGRLKVEDITTGRPHGVYIMRESLDDDDADLAPALPELPALRGGWVPAATEDDPLRWNRALSEAFDVTTATFEPANAEIDLAAKFTGTAISALAQGAAQLSGARVGAWLLALDEALRAWEVLDVRNIAEKYDSAGPANTEKPPVHEMIRLNAERRQDFLIEGTRFMQHRESGARMTLKVQPTWWGLHASTLAPAEAGVAQALLDEVSTAARALKLLQGEAFSLSGEFLTRDPSDGFDGLFLAPEQMASLRQVVTLLADKGAAMPPRGLMLIGPPGTGKTTAARVLLNESARAPYPWDKCIADQKAKGHSDESAKKICGTIKAQNATFVWVSARDFFRFGSYGVFTYAFDLLREQGPGIVVFEDVDHWISKETVDLIKTEMDGLARNNGGIVTLLTSNYPERMPDALINRPGRFHEIIRCGLPDAATREAMLRAWAPAAYLTDPATLQQAVAETEGYSGAHVRELVTFATILHEQDAVPVVNALARALAKLAEQRKLIDETRREGGHRAYEPTSVTVLDAVLQRWHDAGGPPNPQEGGDWLPVVVAEIEAEQRAGKVIARRNQTRIERGRDVLLTMAAAVSDIAATLREGAAELQAVLDDATSATGAEATGDAPAPGPEDMMASVRAVADDLAGTVAQLEVASLAEVAREFSESADELEADDIEEPQGGFYDEIRAALAATLDSITAKEN